MSNVIKINSFNRRVFNEGNQDILRYLDWAQKEGKDVLCMDLIRDIYYRFDIENLEKNYSNIPHKYKESEFKPAHEYDKESSPHGYIENKNITLSGGSER